MGVTKEDTRSLDDGSYAESLQATIPYSLVRRMSSTCFPFVAYLRADAVPPTPKKRGRRRLTALEVLQAKVLFAGFRGFS